MPDFEKMKQAALASLAHPGESGEEMPKNHTGKGNLFIFRHCQTYDNIRRIFSGRRQTNLTETGNNQAKSLAQKLSQADIDMFISPPLIRCQQTLNPLRLLYPQAEYIVKPELIERNYGDLTGKSKMTIMRLYPKEAVLWRRSWDVPPPQGESLKQVWETRIHPFCLWLEKTIEDRRINVAYAGTNNTMRLIRMHFEKLSIEEMLEIEMQYGDYASYHITKK